MKQAIKRMLPLTVSCFAMLALLSMTMQHSFAQPNDRPPTPGQDAGADLPPPEPTSDLPPPQPSSGAKFQPSNTNNNAAKANTTSALPQELKEKLGDYVELDDAIKNEMYGTIDFPNADLKDIVKAISKLANKNFIFDSKINNRKITIVSPAPVTKQEAYNAFLSALYFNSFTVVSMGRFLKIIEAKDAIQSNIRVFMGDFAPASEEVVTVLYPLKFLNADEIQRFLTDLVPRNGRISSYPNTNTLVMTDTGLNLRRIVGILKSIDVPGHEDQLENIQIHYASAKGISQLIDDILEAQSGSRRTGGSVRNQPQKTRGGGIITKIVPDERTNSLVVLANGRGVAELKLLVSKLDSPDAAGGGNIHIYFCKNAVAEELAGTINQLISGQKTSTGGGGGSSTNPPGPIGANQPRRDSGDGVKFEGNIKVTFDKPSNSLVVVASGSDFTALRMVLRKLDVPRRQVYVEGTIMEISVNDIKQIDMGAVTPVGAFVPSTNGAKTAISALVQPANLTGAVALFSAGKSVDVTLPNGKVQNLKSITGLIRAIQDSNQGNILHQPQILTSDNQEAEIKVTTKVPVDNGATTASTGVVTTNVSREEITIALKITPQIGKDNDLVKLKVEQQMDDFNSQTSSGVQNQIETTTRKETTTVIARTGDTVVVGGLQKNLTSDKRSKFPLIGDLPILGWLFKGSSSDVKRSNLVLFLTPHIINEYHDLINLTKDKLEIREQLGQTQYDPADRFAKEIHKIKKHVEDTAQKPEPRGWGFKPSDTEDGDLEEKPTSKAKEQSDSASNESSKPSYVEGLNDTSKPSTPSSANSNVPAPEPLTIEEQPQPAPGPNVR